jgi:hypothetical protein
MSAVCWRKRGTNICRPFSVNETVLTNTFVSQLSCSRSHGCIVRNARVTSVRAARRKLVKLFKKPKSKFYWYDFTVRGRRYRASTQETKSVRALQIASLKLAAVMQRTDPLPTKPAVLQEFADRFLEWVNGGRLEDKTRKFYRNGWRLLASTSVVDVEARPDYRRWRRAINVSWLGGKCQLRFANIATNATQSGGVEGDRPRSENQNDERAWTTPSS